MALVPAHLHDIEIQRVVAETEILQPVPRIPPKSPKRFLPMALDDKSRVPESPSFRAELSAEKGSIGNDDYMQTTKWPSTMQMAYTQYYQQQQQSTQQHQHQHHQRQHQQIPWQSSAPPQARTIPDHEAQVSQADSIISSQTVSSERPPLHLQTGPSIPQKDWEQTGSAWREVLWSLKRRTQDEMAIRMREQQVVIDAVSDTGSAHSDRDESPLGRDSLPLQKGLQQSSNEQGWKSDRRTIVDSNGSRHGSGASSSVMEVPVGLAFGAELSQEPSLATQASNDALLQMQPTVRHDMHAIVEEDEEDETYHPTPKGGLGMVNGISVADDSGSGPAGDWSDDEASGEEANFHADDGLWEMLDSTPNSTRTSAVSASRGSSAVQHAGEQLASSRWSRSSRGSMFIPTSGQRAGVATDSSRVDVPPMPPMPRDVPVGARGSTRSSTGARRSRGSVFIPSGLDPVDAAALAKNTYQEATPSGNGQEKKLQHRTPQQWGRGIGVEFGVAY